MKPRYQVSEDAIELIKRFEGFRRVSAQLSDGRWTIGYGHTKSARPGVKISENDAGALLAYDLVEVIKAVNDLTFTPLNQNQFDALVAFAFSIGIDNFRRSAVLRRVNEGQLLQAAYAFEVWRKADFEGEVIVVDALIRRRAAEKALFLKPVEGWIPAPSPVLQPRVDFDAIFSQPRQAPHNLVVPMDGEAAQAHEESHGYAAPSEGGYSSAEAAVDAVTARLQALIPDIEGETFEPDLLSALDVDAAAAEPPQLDMPTMDSLLTPTMESEPPVEDDAPPVLAAVDHPAAPTLVAPEPEPLVEAALEPVVEAEPAPYIGPMGVERRKKKRKASRLKLMPYGPMLALGLVFFFTGVFWGVQEKSLYGLGVAMLGAIMAAVALYFLLAQIDGETKGA